MTGVEAVSNGVMAFRDPTTKNARKSLTVIIALLIVLLAGIALLCRFYNIGATDPEGAGYQSVLSQLTNAVMGHGWFYYVTIGNESYAQPSMPAGVAERIIKGMYRVAGNVGESPTPSSA